MILHIVRCDLSGCDNESNLISIKIDRQPLNTYARPESWLMFDGKDFDSFECVAEYAGQKHVESVINAPTAYG